MWMMVFVPNVDEDDIWVGIVSYKMINSKSDGVVAVLVVLVNSHSRGIDWRNGVVRV